MVEYKDLTKEEALDSLLNIYHKTRITMGFYVPYNIVAALLDKPQIMRDYLGKDLIKESTE